MTAYVFTIYYLIMALLVGLCGIGRKPGFLVTLLLSIVITPFLTLFLLYITKSAAKDPESPR
ncbi:hypothetical protein [Methylogaea oryzae]|uniref:Uncharacterized protein n=1 Tax=Methylogaea oryzae TaxID=1295382 RepID=A0A8D4VN69_9GAMM|nr:hypothetical protein [Methylogaea oryzae]BBL70968.1 hypothetical protein MoryE10_15740 [Methylogaea oryzae]